MGEDFLANTRPGYLFWLACGSLTHSPRLSQWASFSALLQHIEDSVGRWGRSSFGQVSFVPQDVERHLFLLTSGLQSILLQWSCFCSVNSQILKFNVLACL